MKIKILSICFLVLVGCSKPDAPAPAPTPHRSAIEQIPVTMAARDLCAGRLHKFLQEGESVGLSYGPRGEAVTIWVDRRTLQSVFDACGRHDPLPRIDPKTEWERP